MHVQEKYPHLMSVEGWVDDDMVPPTEGLLTYQRGRGLEGDILEIGIYHGKYLILLGKHLGPEESLYGIDIFDSKPSPDAQGNRTIANRNLKKYLPKIWGTDRLVVMEEDSKDFAASEVSKLMEGMFRFISIDGGHDTETCYSDLMLAHRLLVKGGLVALDDWNRPTDWPGVMEGWALYDTWADTRRREPRLHRVWEIPNKLILCNDLVWTSDYRHVLREYLVPA